jgi:hypothetical protein
MKTLLLTGLAALFLATGTAQAAEDTRKWIWRCALVHTPSEEQEAEAERCCKRWPNAPHCNGDYTRAMSLPRCAKLPHLANIKCAATGEVIPTRNPKGYITYTREGRMVALIVRNSCAGAANDHPAAAAPLSSVMNSRRNWAGGVREAYQRGNAADLLQGSYTRRQEQAFACRPG